MGDGLNDFDDDIDVDDLPLPPKKQNNQKSIFQPNQKPITNKPQNQGKPKIISPQGKQSNQVKHQNEQKQQQNINRSEGKPSFNRTRQH